ncbi:MAG: hypothetical protein Ta2E_07880 [Mycoplasmoidaceae bacterium]|nr:MAG: hypothetical protein Ta2E_07880 [Mycoplasmoidaceae bacterium]
MSEKKAKTILQPDVSKNTDSLNTGTKYNKHMFAHIFSYSFINLCKTTSVWVFFIINIALNLLTAIILPLCLKTMRFFPDMFSMANVSLFLVLALGCSMTGESNSDPAERVFILARPIKRSTYLWSKITSTLVISLLLSLCIIVMWIISVACIQPRAFQSGILDGNGPIENQIFVKTDDYEAKALFSIVIIAVFGSVFGTIYRSYLKNRIASMLCMIVVLLFYMVYSILNATSFHHSDALQHNIQFVAFPVFFLSCTIILTGLGFYLNSKEDIRI